MAKSRRKKSADSLKKQEKQFFKWALIITIILLVFIYFIYRANA